MNEGLTSLFVGISALCITNRLILNPIEPMTPLERIEKFEIMEGRSDLKRLYTGSQPKWRVCVPDENEELSFKVYFKGSRGTKLGVAIFEMTPEFFQKYSVFADTDFWEIPESISLVPIHGVIWSIPPKICHCGD